MSHEDPKYRDISRRQFFKFGACASVGTTSLLSTLMSLRQVNAASASNTDIDGDDYKALVCIFLYGGNDSSNMLIPYDTANYNLYAQGRQQLAIPREDLIPLNAENTDGREYALHPSMLGTSELFEQGNSALIANVGTLFAPVTLSDFRNRSSALPPNLFSHSDQQVLWQTSAPESAFAYNPSGWGGRMADLLHSVHNDTSVSMSISLSGRNFFQVGDSLLPFSLSSGGTHTYRFNQGYGVGESREAGFRRLLEKPYANMMETAFADVSNRAFTTADTINSAIEDSGEFDMIPDSGLGRELRMVAKMIQSQRALGQKRQIFFCATGGYDTHGPQLGAHAGLLANLDGAIKGFQDAMVSIDMQDKVTSFTASDFGRTFDSNGRGSDHGWGGHHIVTGGAVSGKCIYGEFPELELGNSAHDTGRGRWLPTTSVDQYGSTLAKWFGVSDNDLSSTVFPNLPNFGTHDLGFMG